MSTLKELSMTTKIALYKLKKVAIEMYGTTELDCDQIQELIKEINSAASFAECEENKSIQATEATNIEKSNKEVICEIIGEVNLKKSKAIFEKILLNELINFKKQVDYVHEKSMEYLQQSTNDMYIKCAKSFLAIEKEFNIERFQDKVKDVSEKEILTEEELEYLGIESTILSE